VDVELQAALDELAIRRLHHLYGDVVNRRAWNELGDLFLPAATVTVDKRDAAPLELQGPHAVGEFIGGSIAQYAFFAFACLSARIDLDPGGDAAAARVYINEIRVDHEGSWSTAYGLYQDEYRRQDGRWWYARRRYHSLARTAPDTDTPGFLVFAHPPS
jgi:hypothetical protein